MIYFVNITEYNTNENNNKKKRRYEKVNIKNEQLEQNLSIQGTVHNIP